MQTIYSQFNISRHKVIFAVLAISSLLFGSLVISTVVGASDRYFFTGTDPNPLTRVSPNPGHYLNVTAESSDSESDSMDDVNMVHVIRNSPTGYQDRIKLRVYYKKSYAQLTAAQRFIQINNITRGCTINSRSANHFARVQLASGASSVQYNIRSNPAKPTASRICGDNSNRTNVALGGAGENANVLGAKYPLPPNLVYDASTKMYSVDLVIRLYTPGDRQVTNDNATNIFRFKVVAPASSGGQVSMQQNTDDRQFGVVGAKLNGDSYGVKSALPFGLPCSAADPLFKRPLEIYDVDNHAFGAMQFYVIKIAPNGDRDRLSRSEYFEPQRIMPDGSDNTGGFSWDSTNKLFRLTSVDEQQNFRVKVDIQPNYRYLQIFRNAREGSGNIVSMAVPTDTIYGTLSCSYNLTPTVDNVPATFTGGSPSDNNIKVTGRIALQDFDSDDHEWKLTARTYSSRPNMSAAENTSLPCSWNSGTSCTSMLESTQVGGFGPGDFVAGPSDNNMPKNLPVGTWVCFVMSVKKPSYGSSAATWRHSALKCTSSSKKPTVQFQGGDLKVGGAIRTSLTETKVAGTMRTFGSWVEYGVFSTGVNTRVSSGAGLRNGHSDSPATPAEWSKLTFSNRNVASYGSFSPLPGGGTVNAVSYFDGLPVTSGGLDWNNSNVYSVANGYVINGPVTVPAGRSIIIKSPGTITINGDIIVQNDNLTDVSQIGQVVIVANAININRGVKQVDSWLLTRGATGSINTCGEVGPTSPNLVAASCPEVLTVNGAVSTAKLYLRRTGGAESTNPQASAEIFRLRPDAQIWAYNYANSGDRVQTVQVTELPPRF